MAAATSSSNNVRVPITLPPHLFSQHSRKDKSPAYHALHHDSALELRGATIRTSGDNGGVGATISLAASNGMDFSGRMGDTGDNDYVLIYDDASRSYVLHKVSTVSHLVASSSGTSTKAATPNARTPAGSINSGATYSPALARTPQSAGHSPSLGSSSHKAASHVRRAGKATDYSPENVATGSGTAKKIASQRNKDSYDSSPTPSLGGGTPIAYGLGISTATARPSSSSRKNHTGNLNKGKAPMHDVEEFDMRSQSDEDLISSSLQLPPSQASVPATSGGPTERHVETAPHSSPGERYARKNLGAAPGSISSHNASTQGVVMSEVSSEDENDFDDLANDLESSLVGQGPFAQADARPVASGTFTHNVITSDEDEDDDDDDDDDDEEDFVNALSEHPKARAPHMQIQRSIPDPGVPAQQAYLQGQQSQKNAQVPQQPAPRPVQAGKKLPTAPRKYDSDLASSSESDDDSD